MSGINEQYKLEAKRWAEKYIREKQFGENPLEHSIAQLVLSSFGDRRMDDVEWDQSVHTGMEAIDGVGNSWIMLNEEDEQTILVMDENFNTSMMSKMSLIPTYEKFELKRVFWV